MADFLKCLRDWGHFNIEKFKSLGKSFFDHMEEKSIWGGGGGSDNGNQRGGVGHNSGQKQLSYYSIIFQGKVTFMVTFKEKMVSFLHH